MLGHPQTITAYAEVDWTKPEDICDPTTKYKIRPEGGFWKVKLHPPRGLRIPVNFFIYVIKNNFLDCSCSSW